jgi:hypothetical protein
MDGAMAFARLRYRVYISGFAYSWHCSNILLQQVQTALENIFSPCSTLFKQWVKVPADVATSHNATAPPIPASNRDTERGSAHVPGQLTGIETDEGGCMRTAICCNYAV